MLAVSCWSGPLIGVGGRRGVRADVHVRGMLHRSCCFRCLSARPSRTVAVVSGGLLGGLLDGVLGVLGLALYVIGGRGRLVLDGGGGVGGGGLDLLHRLLRG